MGVLRSEILAKRSADTIWMKYSMHLYIYDQWTGCMLVSQNLLPFPISELSLTMRFLLQGLRCQEARWLCLKNGHTIYGSLKGTCWWKVHQVSPVGILCFVMLFFKITVVKPFQENFEWSKTNDLFFLAVLLFYLILFFGIMICVPLGLYFRLPPKKKAKKSLLKKNTTWTRNVSQSPCKKKTLPARRPRPRRRRPRKRRAEELPRRWFFHGSQTWDG